MSKRLSEAAVQQQVRLRAAKRGVLLFRNNSGAMIDATGRLVRFGLANDSKKMNTKTKSSDLIGIYPQLILPEHVGSIIGRFVAIEDKHSEWVYTGTLHEQAQKNFMDLIVSKGGLAQFANGVESISWLK